MSSPLVGSAHCSDHGSSPPLLIGSVLEYIYGGPDRLDRALRSISSRASASTLQGCLPLLMQEVPPEVLAERIGHEKYERVRSCYREMSLLNLWYSVELKQVLGAIAAAGISVLVLKGADVAATLYPRPDLRYFGDVDLMVQPEHLEAAIAILADLGYFYMQEYRFEAISKQRAAFVYVKAVPAGHLMIELHTSPHANELGISFNVADIWKRARVINIFDTPVRGMGLEDLLLYLCWHYRSHYFNRLIWLYDIALVLLRCGDQLDWMLLYRLADRCGLKGTVYYIVQWCQQLFHIKVPEEARIERYAPPTPVSWLIRRFIGKDTTHSLRRSAGRERKLLQHLVVDDLKTLCLVELRAIFPSPSHLGRLYMEHSSLPLHLFWLYYFLHPLLALREVLRAVFRTMSSR